MYCTYSGDHEKQLKYLDPLHALIEAEYNSQDTSEQDPEVKIPIFELEFKHALFEIHSLKGHQEHGGDEDGCD